MAKFKIGDKVKVVRKTPVDSIFKVEKGMVGIVAEESQFPYVTFLHGTYPMSQEQLELVEEEKDLHVLKVGTVHVLSPAKRQCLDIAELLEKKNEDYDSAFSKSYKEFGMTSVAIRLNDKVERLKNLVKGNEPNFESVDDTLQDIAGYAILALAERRED